MADERIRLIVEAEDRASAALQSVQRELRGVGKDAQKTSSKGLSGAAAKLKSLAAEALAATGILVSFGAAAKKAFAMGEEGAELRLLRRSFDRLMESVGVGPGVLDGMRSALRDTVDEATLMSSANTLLAGTSGRLQRELAAALPELARIADAAHRLNPRLGSTTFLMNSLASGVKRGSKLLIDNLGIVFSLQDAYAEYAKRVGKTVDALTDEDQKLALLYATMRHGEQIVQQAGADGDEMTDAYAQMHVAITEAADALKEELAPAMADVARGIYWVLSYHKKLDAAYQEHEKHMREVAGTYDEYITEMLRAAVVAGKLTQEQADLDLEMVRSGTAGKEFYEKMGLLSQAMWDGLKQAEELGDGFEDLGGAAGDARQAVDDLAQAHQNVKEEMARLGVLMAGRLGEEMRDYQEQHDELIQKLHDTGQAIADLRAKQEEQGGWLSPRDREQLDALIQKQDDLGRKVRETADAHDEATKRILFDLVQQRLASDGLSQAEFDFLTGLAQKWGLVDQATATAVAGIDKSMEELATSGNAQKALDMLDDVRRTVEGIPTHVGVDIDVNVRQHGSVPMYYGTQRYRPPKMAGGALTPGAAYMVAEAGRPEVVVPTGPAVVKQIQFDNNFNIQAQAVDGASIRREMAWMEWTAYHGY